MLNSNNWTKWKLIKQKRSKRITRIHYSKDNQCSLRYDVLKSQNKGEDEHSLLTRCSWVATKVWNPGATPKPSSWTNGGSAWLWICTLTPASNAVSSISGRVTNKEREERKKLTPCLFTANAPSKNNTFITDKCWCIQNIIWNEAEASIRPIQMIFWKKKKRYFAKGMWTPDQSYPCACLGAHSRFT